MTRSSYSKQGLHLSIKESVSSPETVLTHLNAVELPDNLQSWLTKLSLLKGVPFNYLVPDEKILPPESIRFFYLDPNWVGSLVDGAFSIGRNLSDGGESNKETLAVHTQVETIVSHNLSRHTPSFQSLNLFCQDSEGAGTLITGFILSSSLVSSYPRIGVNAYAKGHTPSDSDTQQLKVLRLEQLSKSVLICLIEGDAYHIDIHEPSETLHYGIDCFNNNCNVSGKAATAVKNIRAFNITTNSQDSIKTNTIKISANTVDIDISNCFRPTSSRVMNMCALSDTLLKANNTGSTSPPKALPTSINSSEMGFMMTQGVGMVSFIKSE